MEIDLKYLDAFEKYFSDLNVSSLQLMLRQGDKVYLLHTMKESFEQVNKSTQNVYKSRNNVKFLTRHSSQNLALDI